MSLIVAVFSSQSFARSTDQALMEKTVNKGELRVIIGSKSAAVQTQTRSSQMRKMQSKLASMGMPVLRQIKTTGQTVTTVTPEQLNSLLADDALVVYEDRLLKPMLNDSVPVVYPHQDSSTYHGNDASNNRQWAVAVLDTGIDKSHPFLAGKVISEACYSNPMGDFDLFSFCPSGISSTATGSGDACSADDCEHGTQMAGIIAGNGNSFDGVAREAALISIQVAVGTTDLDQCLSDTSFAPCVFGAFTSDIVAGLERVLALRNTYNIASVLVSYGFDGGGNFGTCDGQPETAIIDQLRSAGIAAVFPSGNYGNASGTAGNDAAISVPACVSSAIAVGSVNATGGRSAFSNQSIALDLYAPGENINTSIPGGGFAAVEGTSAAAAHVAGAWAVIKNCAPNESVNQIEQRFKSTGPTVGSFSTRRINIEAALAASTTTPCLIEVETSTSFLPAIMLLLLDE